MHNLDYCAFNIQNGVILILFDLNYSFKVPGCLLSIFFFLLDFWSLAPPLPYYAPNPPTHTYYKHTTFSSMTISCINCI